MIYVLMCKNVQGVNFWKYRQIPFLLSDVCFLNSNFFAGKLFLQTSKYLEKKSHVRLKWKPVIVFAQYLLLLMYYWM